MASKVSKTPSLPKPSGDQIHNIFAWATQMVRVLFNILTSYATRLNAAIVADGSEVMTAPLVLATYTVATVPTASSYTQGLIYVSDETGGAVPAFSDGTNWRRVTDRAIIS